MGKPDNGNGEEEMENAVRMLEQRKERWLKEGERPLWQNLSMIGALGWLIVVPILLAVFFGRWLDRIFGTGITFSAAFICLGLVLGCYLAWKRINEP